MGAYTMELDQSPGTMRRLNDGDIIDQLGKTASEVLDTGMNALEGAGKTAAESAVRDIGSAASGAVNRALNPGGTQPAETRVTTTTSSAGGTVKTALTKYGVPAAAAAGIYLWKKSLLWAAVAGVGTYIVAGKMKGAAR